MKAKRKTFVVAMLEPIKDPNNENNVFMVYNFIQYCSTLIAAQTFLENVKEPYYYLTILEIYE
jgi:hypothetical protein